MSGEFDFVEKIKRRAAKSVANPAVRSGIGDDCAVLAKDGRTDLVISTDMLVEDIDFRLDWSKPEFVGHKSLAVSLSDIAAMGAKPVWSMISIGVPENIWKTDFIEKFYDGYLRLAKKFNVALIGGDVSRAPEKIVIDSIAAGETKMGKAVLRSGAKAGDLIFVTGKIGGAAAGLKLLEKLKKGEKPENSIYKNLFSRQLKPQPQTEIGQFLGDNELATAMIDLSDGLSGDLFHLCRASRVGAKIFADKIPAEFQIPKISPHIDKFDLIFNGGEDFELLFTVNPKKYSRRRKLFQKYKFSLIGEITDNIANIELIENNRSEILLPKGFQHF